MEGALYDGIVSKYSAIKTNPYKVHVEEPTVWACLGDLVGQIVLDMACGNGHYRVVHLVAEHCLFTANSKFRHSINLIY